MANKVLEELRSVCGGTVLFEGPTLVGIVERAIAEAVEEAASQPERQFAEHQARLVKAKADKAEWELYMATEGLRVPSFVELPSESKPLEVYIAGLRFFVNKPTDTVSDGKGNTTMTAAIGVDLQSAEPVRRIFMDEFDANWGKPAADPTIASIPETVVQAPTRQNPYMALPEEPADAKQRTEELRAAEERGFQNARWRVLHSIIEAQDNDDGLTKKQFALLMRFKAFVDTMRMEG